MSLPLLALVVLAMGLLFAFLPKRGEHQHTREVTTHQHCSACLNAHPTAEVRGMPSWNDHAQTFSASYRSPLAVATADLIGGAGARAWRNEESAAAWPGRANVPAHGAGLAGTVDSRRASDHG